ncbi:MAG TPA: YncE family protein [Spirillospora sp.]
MRGRRGGRSRAATLPLAAAGVLTCGMLTGCESPVPFYRPGEGAPDGPVVGLGGPAPYLSARPDGAPGAGSGASPGTPGDVPTAPAGRNVYAATGPGMTAPNARGRPARLYVAHGRSVEVIDPLTLRTLGRMSTGTTATRIVPSWNLRRLWGTDRARGVLVPLGPPGAGRGRPVRVAAPSGLYFTPDGRDALVLAGRPDRVDVRDPRTMRRRTSLPMPCAAGHADFTIDGASLVATCTSAGVLARVDLTGRRVAGTVRLPAGARPGDLRLSPDGTLFYVADSARGGVWLVDAVRFSVLGFVRTAPGARGLVIGRHARLLYVVGAGTLTAVEFGTRRVAARWPLPGDGSPVPGGMSPDGTALWLAGSDGLVYAVSTRTGRVVRRVRIAGRPSGLCVHPQPGRYSLGGTGLYR